MAEAINEKDNQRIKEDMVQYLKNIKNMSSSVGGNGNAPGAVNSTEELLKKLSQFDIVPENKKSTVEKPVNEIGNNLKTIFNYMQGNTDEKAQINSNDWQKNVSKPKNALNQAIDRFNELTGNEYADSWLMKLLKKIADVVDEMDMGTQTTFLKQTPAAKAQVQTEKLKEKSEQSIDALDKLKEVCREKFVDPQTAAEAANTVKILNTNGMQKVAKEKADIGIYEERLNTAMEKNGKFANLRLAEGLMANRINEMKVGQLQANCDEKTKALNAMLGSGTMDPKMKKALTTRMEFANFVQKHPFSQDKKGFEAFKESFIKENPLKLDTKALEKAQPEQMRNVISHWLQNNNKQLNAYRQDEKTKTQMGVFDAWKMSSARLDIAKKEQSKSADFSNKQMDYFRKVYKGSMAPEKMEEYLKKQVEDVSKMTDMKRLNAAVNVVQKREEVLAQSNPDAKMITDILKAKKEFVRYCGALPNQINSINARIQPVQESRKALEQTVHYVKTSGINTRAVNSLNRIHQTEENMKAGLERFSEQLEQGKRTGHIDSRSFRTLVTALNTAKENMSPANFKVLQTAADEYLEQKGTGNPFNSKMRQHRMDLAQSISAFAQNCQEPAKQIVQSKPSIEKLNQQVQKIQKLDLNAEMKNIKGTVNQELNNNFKKTFQGYQNALMSRSNMIESLENAFALHSVQKQQKLENKSIAPNNPKIEVPKINAPQVNAPQVQAISLP